MADDIARVPTQSPGLANTSELWQKNASWETHEELFQLSDAIGSSDIIGLKPIYRKDLPADYIAYWEVKLNAKTGEKYMIISAAKETGDHRLAEEGSLPSPLDRMSDSAMMFGHSCHKVYRLTPDGLMVCEDTTVRRIVAATRDVDTDSVFEEMRWRRLDRQVQKALPRFKKVWKEHAKRVTKLPQWKRFNWLSMKSGRKPTKQSHDFDDDDYDDDDDDSGIVEELGIKPGDKFQIPLGSDMFPEGQCRIKFVGLRNTKAHGKRRKSWSNRWQRRLCRVLDDACEGADLTLVKQSYVKQTEMGDRYVKLQIRANSRYVRRQLQGQEVRFRIEIRTNRKKSLVIHYGIILKNSRTGRSVHSLNEYSIPHKDLFPSYMQHHNGQCLTGSAAVAWGMVLGYMNNVGHRYPELGYPKNIVGLSSFPLPLTMRKTTELLIEKIYSTLNSACSPTGSADTSPAKMKRIGKLLNDKNWRFAIEKDRDRSTWRTIKILKHGFPVIVSKMRGTPGHHHYAVATKLRQRHRFYRKCVDGICSDWRTDVESEIFVHLGLGPKGNKWENVDTYFMAAIFNS